MYPKELLNNHRFWLHVKTNNLYMIHTFPLVTTNGVQGSRTPKVSIREIGTIAI